MHSTYLLSNHFVCNKANRQPPLHSEIFIWLFRQANVRSTHSHCYYFSYTLPYTLASIDKFGKQYQKNFRTRRTNMLVNKCPQVYRKRSKSNNNFRTTRRYIALTPARWHTYSYLYEWVYNFALTQYSTCPEFVYYCLHMNCGHSASHCSQRPTTRHRTFDQ